METIPDGTSQLHGFNTIGIHVTLPGSLHWNHVSEALFAYIISNAVIRSGHCVLDHETAFPGQFAFIVASKDRDLFGLVSVSDLPHSLKIVICELKAIGLLDGSHVAWYDPRERVWRAFSPNPAITAFDVLVRQFLGVFESHSPGSGSFEFIEAMRKIERRNPNSL